MGSFRGRPLVVHHTSEGPFVDYAAKASPFVHEERAFTVPRSAQPEDARAEDLLHVARPA